MYALAKTLGYDMGHDSCISISLVIQSLDGALSSESQSSPLLDKNGTSES